MYMPHNRHMLWASASLDGRQAVAMETARGLAEYTKEMLRHPQMAVGAQHFWLSPLYAMVRWGMWNEILAVPEPEADLVYPRAVWHYAQGLAALRTGKADAAKAHADALRQTLASGALDALMYNFNSTANLMKIASNVLDGEILAAKGDTANAVEHFETAVATEDALVYDEPPPWHVPARQNLGAVLLRAGKPAEAEAVYRADLDVYPWNGWSLYGLAASFEAQDKAKDASMAQDRFERTWKRSDVTLKSSAF